MTDNQVLEIINICQANALTPQGKIGKELIPEVRELLSAPAQGVEEAAYPNEYVCGFLFDKQVQQVVLIWKEKPAWQKGKLNGVGGKIEKGETPYQAMVREFKEETGLQVENWQPLADVNGDDWCVHFFFAADDCNQFEYAETKEIEEVGKIEVDRLDEFECIPNLYWLIPMAVARIKTPGENIVAGSRWQQGQGNKTIHVDLESREFFDLMQQYRIAPMEDQEHVINRFEAVKKWLKDRIKQQPFPTIGARWVRGEIEKRISYLKKADAEVCKERWDMTQPELKRSVARDTSNFLTERRHELEDLLKTIPADESPATLDAGWIPGTPKLEKPCVFASMSGKDYSVWKVLYLDQGDGSYLAICNGDGEEWGDIADFHCDAYYMLSPATFPTREEAEQWAKSDSKHVWFEEEWLAALAMYDWIVQQLNPHP